MSFILANPSSHKMCKHFFSESYSNFLLTELKPDELVKINSQDFNHLIVILKGRLLIEYDEFVNGKFGEDEFVFIPSYSKSFIKALENSKVLIGTFELPNDVCNLRAIEALADLKSTMPYRFTSVPAHPPMKQFIDLLVMYLESGIQCAHLHEIKEKEIFLIFRWYYTDEEFVTLFHPIVGRSLDFRAMVIKNYTKVKNSEELAAAMGMSRSNFDAKFKDVFGIPPKQWILKRKARSIRYFMSKPNVTISDVMIQFGFDSFTHFNRFCKKQFDATPSELIKQKDFSGLEYDKDVEVVKQ